MFLECHRVCLLSLKWFVIRFWMKQKAENPFHFKCDAFAGISLSLDVRKTSSRLFSCFDFCFFFPINLTSKRFKFSRKKKRNETSDKKLCESRFSFFYFRFQRIRIKIYFWFSDSNEEWNVFELWWNQVSKLNWFWAIEKHFDWDISCETMISFSIDLKWNLIININIDAMMNWTSRHTFITLRNEGKSFHPAK